MEKLSYMVTEGMLGAILKATLQYVANTEVIENK